MVDATGLWLEAAGRVPLLTHREELELGRLVQAWQQWPGGVDAAPPLVRRRGLRARERMVMANLRLVVAQARRYWPRARLAGYEMSDLLQEGVLGLQRGAEKFDFTRGYKFSTYAVPWIKQAMGRMLDRHGGAVRVPAQVGSAMTRLKAGALQWEEMEPGLQKRVKAALQLQRVLSLDAQVGEDGSTLVDLVAA
jgi:RNA polymerase sigma factor (sigma-70 family)